jgi:hypothetical protein
MDDWRARFRRLWCLIVCRLSPLPSSLAPSGLAVGKVQCRSHSAGVMVGDGASRLSNIGLEGAWPL